MHVILIVLYVAIGIVQICAIVKGIQYYFDVSTFVAAFGGLVVSYIPFIGAAAGIWGAVHGWEWFWWQAILLFMWQPIIYMFASGTVSIFSYIQNAPRKANERANPTSVDVTLEKSANPATSRSILKRLFYGELSLPISYWVFGVLASIAWNYSFKFIAYLFQSEADIAVVFARNFGVDGIKILIMGLMLLFYAYSIVSLVGQWRSASRYRGAKGWAYAVKTTVFIGWVFLVGSVVYVIDFINM